MWYSTDWWTRWVQIRHLVQPWLVLVAAQHSKRQEGSRGQHRLLAAVTRAVQSSKPCGQNKTNLLRMHVATADRCRACSGMRNAARRRVPVCTYLLPPLRPSHPSAVIRQKRVQNQVAEAFAVLSGASVSAVALVYAPDHPSTPPQIESLQLP